MEEQQNMTVTQEMRDAFVEAMASAKCVVCSRPKRVARAFCDSCTFAMPIWARNWIGEGAASDRACESFRIWRRNLELIGDRIKRSGWDFHSWEEIESAGYKLLNVSRCRATGCGQRIGWVEDAHGNKTPLNVEGDAQFQPHRTTCKNPGVFRERKSVQSSARAKKRAR